MHFSLGHKVPFRNASLPWQQSFFYKCITPLETKFWCNDLEKRAMCEIQNCITFTTAARLTATCFPKHVAINVAAVVNVIQF